MGGISDEKKTDEKLFAWAKLIAATTVFIFGSVVANRFIEAITIKGGNVVRALTAGVLIFMLIVLVLRILYLQ